MGQVIYNLHGAKDPQKRSYLLAYAQAQGLTKDALFLLQPLEGLEALSQSIFDQVVKGFFAYDATEIEKVLNQPRNRPPIQINAWGIPPVRKIRIQERDLELHTPDNYSAAMILLSSNNLLKAYLREQRDKLKQEVEFHKRFPNPAIDTLDI